MTTRIAPDVADEIRRLRFEERWSIRGIGEKLGVNYVTVFRTLGPSGPGAGGFWGECAAKKALKEIVAQSDDKTNRELADLLGRSRYTVASWRKGTRHAVEANSNIGIGAKWEEWVANELRQYGFAAELMPILHPFDILVNGCVRIDVKSANVQVHAPTTNTTSPFYRFTVKDGKKRDDTDFYILVIAATLDAFVVPANLVPRHQRDLFFVWPSSRKRRNSWREFHNRYDLITAFLQGRL